MKLLVIGCVWPEPNSSAAGSRMLQLLAAFQERGFEITFASSAARSDYSSDLDALGIQSERIAVNCSSFDNFIYKSDPQIVLFDRFMTEEQFGWRVEEQCPEALRVLEMSDFHSLRLARHEAVKSGQPAHAADLHTETAMREVAAILRCDLNLVISSYEMELLIEHYDIPPTQLMLLPFMLEAGNFDPAALPAFADRAHFLSIGNFRHPPNWDAVLELKRLWPALRAACPEAELHIYGSYTPKKATQLDAPAEGFRILDRAEDVSAVMQQARICLAPLRFGAGLKGKLLDAMIAGTPSVTSSIGVEGMVEDQQAPHWAGSIADTDEAFIEAATRLYRDPIAWNNAQSAIPQLLSIHDGAAHRETLLARIDHLQANLSTHRQSHFLGAMLRHHTLKSHRYMARWIEAKNANKTE